MRRGVGMHRANHAKVVGMACGVGKEAADFESALAMLGELERRLHEMPDRAAIRADLRIALIRLAVILFQSRFRIKGVHLARPAVHEEEHAILGFGREMRTLIRQRRGGGRFTGEQIRKRQSGKAATRLRGNSRRVRGVRLGTKRDIAIRGKRTR